MPENKKVTLKSMAAILGVTPATVSKALRDSNDISEEMRNRVKRLAAEVGYRPNIMARSLTGGKSRMFGVIVPDLRISFFSEVARGMYERADELDYVPILLVNDEKPEIERRNVEFFCALGVDGILLNPAPGTENYPVYRQLADEGRPVVCYDRYLDAFEFSSVTIDDSQAAYNLVSQLIKDGRKRILYLGPTEGLTVAVDRFNGYRRALKEGGIPFNRGQVVHTNLYIDDAYRTMTRVLRKEERPDAVLCVGGLSAYGAGRAMLDSGVAIPEEIALGEFGDNDIISRLGVPFFTINQNPYQIGVTAVDLLVRTIESGPDPITPQHVHIETKLIHRTVGTSAAAE